MFPIECGLAQFPRFVRDANFDNDKGQQLPPTFRDCDPDPEGIRFGHVLHELTATLTTSEKKLFSSTPKSVDVTRALNLVKAPQKREKISDETPAPIDVGWYRSNGDFFPIETPHFSIRVAMGLSKPNHVSSPNADFTIRIQFPSIAQIGQPIPVSINLLQDTELLPDSALQPGVLLRRLSLQLQTVTLVRGSYGKALADTQRDTHCWDSTQTVLSCVFGQALKLTGDVLDLRDFADLMIEPNVVPSFKTFNVARQYYLSATFVIVASGKTSQPTSTERSLIVITGKENADTVGGEASGSRNTESSGSVMEEQLPAYEAQS